jgi:iron complex transport system substrate-binding protein
MMRRATLALSLAAAFAASGCGARAEPVGPLAQQYPVRVQGSGDSATVLTQRPERIVALDPGAAELLAALGVGERLVGVPAGLADQPAEAATVVSPTGQVLVEEVVAAKPDLIVATPAVDPLDVSRAARESGGTAYVQPVSSVENVLRGTIELGFLVGEAPRARKLSASIRRDVARVEARVAELDPVPVFVDTGFLITVPDRSLMGDLVRRARGDNVADPTPSPEPPEACEVAALEPSVVLVVKEEGRRIAPPRFDDCRKARNLEVRIARVPAELVLRPGPRLAEALEAVARGLHPDAFG